MIEPDSTHISPDGRVRIEYSSDEMRMSLWVDRPHVVDVATGRTIFKPSSSLVSGQHEWGEDGTFSLGLRKYPDGRFWVNLLFDLDEGTVRIDGEDEAHPITHAARLTDHRFAAYVASEPSPFYVYPSEPRLFHDLLFTKWGRVRLAVILILLVVALGIATDTLPLATWVSRML